MTMNRPFSPNRLPGRTVHPALTAQVGLEVVRIEAIPVSAGEVVQIRFERATSIRRQGVWLATEGVLEIGGEDRPQFVLWADGASTQIEVTIVKTDGLIRFNNVYEFPPGSGLHRSQMNGSGMIRRDRGDGWIEYACNDFGIGEGFEKLIFSIRSR